jgi:glycosyltransferase involved in cell wall biosynthesis
MRKKILILNWRDIKNPKSGGGDNTIHRLAKHLVEMGNDVCLLCSKFLNCKQSETIDGVKIIRMGSEYLLPISGFLFLLKNSFTKYEMIIEVINVVPWFTPLYTRIPKIIFIHQTQTQQLKHSNFSSIKKEVNPALESLILALEKFIPILYRKINFITVSETVKEDLAQLGIKKNKIKVVHNGIDKIEENTRIKKNTHPTILYLGRLKKYKGVQYLILALREIIKTIPNAELKIVGKGDYEQELKKLSYENGLQNHVTFHGFVTDEEKYAIIQSSWILAIASLNEGWCIPVIEAGNMGVPTIAFANGGLNDSIKNNVTGLLVQSENVEELTKKIIALIRDDKLRNKLGENAREYSNQFLWPKQLKLFSEALETH